MSLSSERQDVLEGRGMAFREQQSQGCPAQPTLAPPARVGVASRNTLSLLRRVSPRGVLLGPKRQLGVTPPEVLLLQADGLPGPCRGHTAWVEALAPRRSRGSGVTPGGVLEMEGEF